MGEIELPDILCIGAPSATLPGLVGEGFRVHLVSQMDDADAWIAANGYRIAYVATDGHLGVRPAWVAQLPNLKLISCFGVGYEAIDADAANSNRVVVTHTPDILNDEVATTALMLVLACRRELLRDDHFVRSGAWETSGAAPLTRTVDSLTFGFLGMGRIAGAIVEKLTPFHPTVLYHARSPKPLPHTFYDNLTEMAHDCDVLICITPGGKETRHLVNEDVLNALGPSGTLINVSRGSVVDEAALINALETGRLGAAGLDVFEDEPRVPERLRAIKNTVLLPHVGSATIETRAAMAKLTADNILAFHQTGKALTPVPECARG